MVLAMSPTGRQLVLEIAPRPAFGREDFLVSPSNEAAFAHLETWPGWPDPVTLLVGPGGVGKSHLAAVWARAASATILSPGDLRTLPPHGPVLVDDAHLLRDETALFHLINLVGERGTSLLLTASRTPENWPVRLPDLLSRLRRATRIEIAPPDDDLIRAVLVKLLIDRQLLVDTSVVEYIARRIDRSLDAAREIVRRLDVEALSGGRRISRGLAAEVLRDAPPDQDQERH